MLTPRQYEAMGRLALGFNELEFVFECYTAAILGTPELRLASILAEDGSFHQKAARFKRVLIAIREEYPELETHVAWVLQIVTAARMLAESRNEYIHALVMHDFATNQTRIRVRGTQIEYDEQAVTRTAAEAHVLVARMHETCGELIAALANAREQS